MSADTPLGSLGGNPERVGEAAQAAGLHLTEAEATALAAIFADLGPTERIGRWAG